MARAKRAKGEPLAIEAGSGNVFEDLGLPDAGERLAKAEVARVIRKIVKDKNWTQRRAADVLGIAPRDVSDLMRGELARFARSVCMANCKIVSLSLGLRDPLYRFHQWQVNLRILNVKPVKTVPYVPLSHPFVERLIGTIRRECLDRTLFSTAADLESKLVDFQRCYNGHRTHAGLDGRTPEPSTDPRRGRANVSSYRWQPHCRGLYQTPMTA